MLIKRTYRVRLERIYIFLLRYKPNSLPMQDESFMTVPVTRRDENRDGLSVGLERTASGPKVVSGSGADKPADESGLEAWRNKGLLLLPTR